MKANLRLSHCCYAANIHHISHSGYTLQPSEEPLSFQKKLQLNLKSELHELAKQVRLSGCLGGIRKAENKDEKDG